MHRFSLYLCSSKINRKPSTLPITRKEASTVSGAGIARNRSEMPEIAIKSDERVLSKQSINFKKKGKIIVQNPQFLINIRKNINANNPGYGKYYPKAVEKETITLRGLAKHMSEHQCVYSRDIIEGVLIKMASCMIELIAQGNPIKIDGLGIFWPTVESTKEGITRAALLEGKWNANTYVKGVHIRFRPEGAADDNITSRTFKDMCSLSTYGVEEKIDLTPEESDPSKKKYIKKVTPLEDWILEQTTQNP